MAPGRARNVRQYYIMKCGRHVHHIWLWLYTDTVLQKRNNLLGLIFIFRAVFQQCVHGYCTRKGILVSKSRYLLHLSAFPSSVLERNQLYTVFCVGMLYFSSDSTTCQKFKFPKYILIKLCWLLTISSSSRPLKIFSGINTKSSFNYEREKTAHQIYHCRW